MTMPRYTVTAAQEIYDRKLLLVVAYGRPDGRGVSDLCAALNSFVDGPAPQFDSARNRLANIAADHRDAARYRVVRAHAADVTPEEMDHGADAILAQMGTWPTACSNHEQLVALVKRYASECGECAGKGYIYEGDAITGRGPDDVFPEQVACPECADIRSALAALASLKEQP
jgi:hypothetical protein